MRRHAVKQVRRYRYTIEQRLVQDGGVGTKGVRYGAEEVDKAGLVILQRFLNSPAEIVAALAIGETSPGSCTGSAMVNSRSASR